MQIMNTDQQTYYSNGYYVTNGLDQQYSIRNPNGFAAPRMPQQFYNPQMPNHFGHQMYVTQSYLPNAPFVHTSNPRGVNPTYVPLIRPPNETPNGTQTFIPQAQYTYPNNNIIQPQNIYSPQQYAQYQMPHTYTSPPPTQISNQPQIQTQYNAGNSQQPSQSSQTSQQSSQDQQHGQSSQTSQSREKRERKPLAIIDPVSHETVKVETSVNVSSIATNPTPITDENQQKDSIIDSTITPSKSSDEISKSQKQAEFRQQFALLLNATAQTEKNMNPTPAEEPSTKDNQPEDVIPQFISSTSASSSRSGSISNKSPEQPQPGHPGIPTRSIPEDKLNDQDDTERDRINSEPQIEPITINSEPRSNDVTDDSSNEIGNQSSPPEVLENVTPTQSNDMESESIDLRKTPSISKRLDYTKEQLRNKRSDPISQERPRQLPDIPGITIPPIPKHPMKPKIGADKQFIRDVTAILNKVTPQTYDVLLKQLEELELNSPERLEGMISVLFVKAVEAAIFCPLYAKLCKDFQKKQVTVFDENGKEVKYFFRQILLTRCQNEFENNDYRQEIEYEKRKAEVDLISDEKLQKEAAEQLEEDLSKAKRKKLGNIIFIGELFKLNMLIDTIMYDCINFLLRDKTDEESLECLCKLLRTIGKELEDKAAKDVDNRKKLEKNFRDLDTIIVQRQTSARIRFMIQDLLEQRKANWVARRAELKPTTIDNIHEEARLKREQEDRDRQQSRSNQNRPNNPQQYTGSSGSRGSGIKQQSNRTDEDRIDHRVIVDSLRQLQSNDKRNAGQTLNLAPQRPWSKGSGVEKKVEDDRSNRNTKPPVGPNQQFRLKTGTPPGTPGYAVQRQPSRELGRENSLRDREKAMESLRKTTNKTDVTSPNNTSITDSREGSPVVSREQSRPASRESSVQERTLPTSKPATTDTNTPFDEEKVQGRVRSLIEEYTGNYSDNNDRPVNEAMEDLSSFCPTTIDQQGIVVRELFTNVLEAKPRARKAVGHLLDAVLQKNIISTEGFLSGIKMIIEVVPDYVVDIPHIWQYIGEILGAFIGGPSSNMILLKPVLELIPETKSKQLFQDVIRYAVEFSSETNVQDLWKSSGFSLNDLLKSDLIDSSFVNEYNWLSDKENLLPHADPQLVKLFKSINDQGTTVTDEEIHSYIQQNMSSKEKFYTRNIVLSYLEACLINREPQKKIQEDIAKKRMTILNAIIEHRLEEEIQAVYAIQNFVNKLEHPPKMARLLFDIFYDEECVSEDAFFEWLRKPDPSESEGHSVVEMSTKDFFIWLEQAETEGEEEEEE